MVYRQKNKTMHFTKLSFNEYMKRVAGLIGNSLGEAGIIQATARFGYDEKRLKEGEQIYRAVEMVDKEQAKAMQKKVKAHKERRSLHTSVRKKYMKMLQISRIAFDNDIIISKALQLEGPRETKLDEWMNQVAVFGNRLLGEKSWIEKLKTYGIGTKEINGLMTELDKLRSSAIQCEQYKTESKKQTALKRQKLKKLQGWVSDYLKIAKIALEEEPKLYEKLIV